MTLDDLHACPFCESSDLYIDECHIGDRVGYCVACRDCGMSGPVSFDGEDMAMRGWEVLCGKMCRHCVYRLVESNKKLRAEIRRLTGADE